MDCKTKRYCVFATTCSVTIWLAQPALAEDESTDVRGPIRVEVTGSNIPRTDIEGALPLTVITREEIDRAGWTTAAELMSHVAENFNGWNDLRSIGPIGGPAGVANANLRSLGSGYTLVLVNGRRVSNYVFQQAVDLSSIPFAAVERIEILRDGASSIYGTDAIAGVVNFILRNDYRGAQVTLQGAVPEHARGDRQQATVSAGFGDPAADRYNVFLNVDWQKDRGLAAQDRAFARTGYRPDEGLDGLSSTGFPGGIQRWVDGQYHGTLYPSAATGCAPPLSIRLDDLHCGFDPVALIDIVPPTETLTVFGRGTLALGAEHRLFAEYSYAHRDLDLAWTPTPISRFNSTNLTPIVYPAGGPYYPSAFAAANGFSGDLDVAFRALDLGRRIRQVRTEAQRLLVGVEGRMGAFDYSSAYEHSTDESRDTLAHGYLSESRLADVVRMGLVNPFGPSGADGNRLLESALLPPDTDRAKAALDQADLRASTQWARLPGGPIGLAAGVEARREKYDDPGHPALETGDVMAEYGFTPPPGGSRRTQAVFVEAVLPVLASLETQLSARYDHYGDFGGTLNPKIALRFQPVRALLLRASAGTGFRAPTLAELHGPQTTLPGAYMGFDDPLRCPVTHLDTDCQASYTAIGGGNPDLAPERSRQYTFGAVWEPIAGVSGSVDYWHVHIRDKVGERGFAIFEHMDVYGDTNIVRFPPDPAYPSLPGAIRYVVDYLQNVGEVTSAGVDVALSVRSAALPLGRVSARFEGSYMTQWEQHLTGLPSAESTLGAIGILGPMPRWHHDAAIDWQRGPWTATLTQKFQSGYQDGFPLPEGNMRRVGSYSVWDVQASYAGLRDVTLTFGIKNLFDRDPPFSNATDNGFDLNYADPRGRTYYARVTYAFR